MSDVTKVFQNFFVLYCVFNNVFSIIWTQLIHILVVDSNFQNQSSQKITNGINVKMIALFKFSRIINSNFFFLFDILLKKKHWWNISGCCCYVVQNIFMYTCTYWNQFLIFFLQWKVCGVVTRENLKFCFKWCISCLKLSCFFSQMHREP